VSAFTANSDRGAPLSRWRVRQSMAMLQGPFVLALAYFVGAEAAFSIGTLSDQIFALFWPPNVILFCALLLTPQRDWWLYLAAAFPAHALAEHGAGMPLPQSLVAFATNCTVALLNAYAVRRFVGDPPWFGNLRKALTYIVITAAIGPAIAALGGAFVPIAGGEASSDYWRFWSHWYLANALPNLTLGPVFLIWLSDEAKWKRWKPSRRSLGAVVLALALVGACALAAGAAGRLENSSLLPAVLFLPLPLILWAAVCFGEKGASGAILIVAVILTWRTLHGHGLFPDADPARSVLAMQLFLTGLSVPVLLLGALIDELKGAERTTRQLAASLVRAQDEERRRIARDLHDCTGQNLIAATLIVGGIEHVLPQAALPAFRQLEDVLQQAIREVRTVSYLLHPPLLDEAGLGLALRSFVEGYVERSGIAVELDIACDIDRLDDTVELVLFRFVQEALTNVSRHSGSLTACIRLARQRVASGHQLVLTIEDAGIGMPEARNARSLIGRKHSASSVRGVGLASMRERLLQIGGRLEIESVVGCTVLRAVVPIHDRPTD